MKNVIQRYLNKRAQRAVRAQLRGVDETRKQMDALERYLTAEAQRLAVSEVDLLVAGRRQP